MVEPIVTIATPAELKLIPKEVENNRIVITGVGPLNVVRMLRDFPREATVLNYGYAGSVDLNIGETYDVGRCALYHRVPFVSPQYILGPGVWCYSSSDFVTEAEERGCVFDMELAYICALGFTRVVARKTISDHCNYKEYERNI